jgi:polyhydroxyalkanoate synthase
MHFSGMTTPPGFAFWLRQADRLRQRRGQLLDAQGFGAIRTPSRIALTLPELQLHSYDNDAVTHIILAVPAPIKRAYIWDLAPSESVIRRCRDNGLGVYLVEWTEAASEASHGLAGYADHLLLACLDAIKRETGHSRVILAGHSLGGTLAAIFAALHPDRLRGLVMLEAPTKFGKDTGPLGRFAPMPTIDIDDASGTIPGAFLDLISIAASPMSFVVARWLDYLNATDDLHAMATHLRVTRWMLDEFPFPGRLFKEIVEQLYRDDLFMRRELTVNGRNASPIALNMPLLSVMRPDSLIIPPSSVLPIHDAAPSRRQLILRYDGDRGVGLQHVGILVGQNAHQRIWPEILRWIDGCT